MAEISYPFTSDSAGGGQQMVSQLQWQYMARQFGKDRIDYRLTNHSITSADLPFTYTRVNNTTVTIGPGRALVGGFFYQLTEAKQLTVAANTGSTGRIDLIVLRADFAQQSVNLAVKQGQAAATPVAPELTKAYGGVWEMPLYQITVPANGAATSASLIAPFDIADTVAVPWNAALSGGFQQNGTFLIDMDNNGTDVQTEYWRGRDGTFQTRHLGKNLIYTPATYNGKTTVGADNRTGRWRRVGPALVYFSATVQTYEDQGIAVATGKTYLGVTLPKPASKHTKQVLTGLIQNPDMQGGYPNLMHIVGYTQENSQNLVLTTPNPNNLGEGLDGLRNIPPRSTFRISGLYETNELD